ncbi:MAG: hypothetical protein BWY57_03186 [Betaproteobacteria bacterium ADurb.Bin341]|nr:MAG: hypothetical protein BWY57_03186 [Betaproteobacteria bacterium ADurb.Bin341]
MRGGFRVECLQLRPGGVDVLCRALRGYDDVLVLQSGFCVLPRFRANLVNLSRDGVEENALRVLNRLFRRRYLVLRAFKVRLRRFERFCRAVPHGEVFFGDVVQERRFRVRLKPCLLGDSRLRVRENDARIHKVGLRLREVRRFCAL